VLIGVLGTIAVLYVLLCAFVFAVQRHIVFPAPQTARRPSPAGELLDVESGTLLFYRAPADGGRVVVYFHGNGEQIADTAWLADFFGRSGIGFASIEYPGYGLAAAKGTPSEAALVDAAERGLRYVIDQKKVAADKIVLMGQSLGTGVAMAMAERKFGSRVVLFCPFTSLPEVGARVFPFLPARLLMRDRFDSISRAPNVNVPVLVLHGSADELIPVELGRNLAARLVNGKFVEIEGGHHNDLWLFSEVEREVLEFLKR